MQDVSVIVPVYNQLPRVLRLCATFLAHRQTRLREVILMDDHSTEFDLTQLVFPPFQVQRNEKNLGFVANENKGASLATGKYLFFANSDLELHPVWLDPAVELLESNPKIGVVGIKLVFPPQGQEVLIQSCGGWYDAGKMPFHRYLGWLENDPRANKTEKVSWVTGAALLTRHDLFEQVGGFDPAYGRGYFDDPDYCESIKSLGYEAWYCAEASATHFVGSSMVAKTPEEQHIAARSFYDNARRFEAKWSDRIKPDVAYQAVSY